MAEEVRQMDVATKIKLESLKKIYQISLLTQLYCDNKKVLKQIKKIVVWEQKRFKGSRFSVTEPSFDEIEIFLIETKSIIRDFLAAKMPEEFNRARKALETHIGVLNEEMKPDFLGEVAQNIKGVIQHAKHTVASVTSAAKEGLSKIKNNICETSDKDCE
ncbi:MAG: hypothetical protein IJV85_02405 [Clostridia bacterium]|nr:hypothetical protein [Clostridia bacterium]